MLRALAAPLRRTPPLARLAPPLAASSRSIFGRALPPAPAARGTGARLLSVAPEQQPATERLLLTLPLEIGPLACNKIKDNQGAHKKKRRVGRGIGSGRGRTSTRGMKGVKARAGNKGLVWKQGGNAPLWKTVPKSGFYRPRLHYTYINLGDLQQHIDTGRLRVPADRPIGVKDLFDAKIITLRQKYAGVKLLGGGSERLTSPLRLEVQDATQRAIEAVEGLGGAIETVYYSRLTLRALLKPERLAAKGQLLPRPALPPPRLMRDLYATEHKRGYLRHLAEGDVVRPQEHPLHVDLDARLPDGPRYPRWHMARYQRDKLAAEKAGTATPAGGGKGKRKGKK